MSLQERITKADNYSSEIKKEVEALIKDYEVIKDNGSPNDLLDVKDRFIALDYRVGNATVLSLELQGKAEIKRKEAYSLSFLDARAEYDEGTGKKVTVSTAEIKAFLNTSEYSITETHAEGVCKSFKHFQSVCSNYITQLSQRIKGVQQDFINSNQSNHA